MEGCFIYRLNYRLNHRLNNDIRNIIEMMVYRYRLKHMNDEYRRVFYFSNTVFDQYGTECPNPHERCVGKYINVIIHWLDGQIHRNPNEGPAVKWANGEKAWYYEGQRHRKDGPAVEYADGTKAWYLNNQRHREDGPAIEYISGTKVWYVEGQLHRNPNEGPAVEYANDHPNEYWEFGFRVK